MSSSRLAVSSSPCGTATASRRTAAFEPGHGYGGVTLAYNARSPKEVDAVIDEARAAGGTITREGGETFWGGYSGVFLDLDGHPWEVAHNPHWTITPDGGVKLPD